MKTTPLFDKTYEIFQSDLILNEIKSKLANLQNKIAMINFEKSKLTMELQELKNKISERKLQLIGHHFRG